MTSIFNAKGEPYFNNTDLSLAPTLLGDWFYTEYETLTLSCELTLQAALSGELYAEFTADPSRQKCISRVILPDGSLHTEFSTITLPVSRKHIALASVISGQTFTVTFSSPGIGSMRWRLGSLVGGGSLLRMLAHNQGRRLA